MAEDYRVSLSNLSYAFAIVKNEEEPMICHANVSFYEMLGYDEQELTVKSGRRLSALLPVKEFLKIQEFLTSGRNDFIMELPLKGNQDKTLWRSACIHKMDENNAQMYGILFYDIQCYKEMQQDLFALNDMFHQVLDHEGLGILLVDPDTGVIQYCYTVSFIVQGHCVNKIFPNVFLDSKRVHPNHIELVTLSVASMKDAPAETRKSCDVQFLNMQNEYVWIRLILAKHTYHEQSCILVILSDINAEKEVAFQYVEQSMFYQSMLSSQDAYAHFDITEDVMCKVGGLWNVYSDLKNKMSYTNLFHEFIKKMIHNDDRLRFQEVTDADNLRESFENGILELGCEFRRIMNQNRLSWMMLTIHLFENPMDKHLMALMYLKNIDDQKHQNISVQMEEYDELTHLYNRKTLEYQVSTYLLNMRNNEIAALLLCNINSLKRINAVYGFQRGDEVLIQVSNILSTIFRKRDILGRLENDKFIILLKDMDTDKLKERMQALFQHLESTDNEEGLTLSLGIVYVEQGDTFVNSLKQADMTLQIAKKHFSNHYEIFNSANIQAKKQSDTLLQYALSTSDDTLPNSNDFDRLVGQQGDMAYIIDPETYELMEGNHAFYKRLNIKQEDCKGRTCYQILHKRSTPCAYCQKTNWSTEKFYMYKTFNEPLEQEFLIKNKLVNWRGELYLLASAIAIENNQNADAVQNDISEDNYIMSGVQNMQKGSHLQDVIMTAMETIASFFRADACRCWCYDKEQKGYDCKWTYVSTHAETNMRSYNEVDIYTIRNWLRSRKWINGVSFDNQEMMMFETYDMYQLMENQEIMNLHWRSLCDHEEELALFEIDNIRVNFENTSFMQSFLSFIVNEWNRCKMVENILYAVKYDVLTGLMNRASYDAFLRDFDSDNVQSVAVVTIDINGLSNINSIKGSASGDQCLKEVANAIAEVFDDARNYRLGADEFESIWIDTTDVSVESKIHRLRTKIKEEYSFSISIGYAWDDVERKIKPLIDYALQSMSIDKKNQKIRIEEIRNIDFYEQQNKLIERIEKGDYLVYLQPKIDATNNSLIGAEALVRRYDKEHGIISPSEYVPQFEKNGLIRYIDLFVYEEVCRLVSKWHKQGKKCPTISLNFSRVTMMDQNLIKIMNSMIEKYATPKNYIEIEITESYADIGKALLYQSAKQIHEAGFSVALDDFGTSFTNLSILSDIHVDVLKIDKSLIHSMKAKEKNLTVLKHIIDMCYDLGITVIAEGVETYEQCDYLKDMGCTFIQGYLFSRPIDIMSFEKTFLPRVAKMTML